jgi:outer membrane biosynthesis protein TonB
MKLVEGQPLLVQAAKNAVQQWKFEPRTASGRTAATQTRVTLNFNLPQ